MKELHALKKIVKKLDTLDKNELLYGSTQSGRFFGNNGVTIGIPYTIQAYKAIPEKVTVEELRGFLQDHIESLEDFDRRVKKAFDKVLADKHSDQSFGL